MNTVILTTGPHVLFDCSILFKVNKIICMCITALFVIGLYQVIGCENFGTSSLNSERYFSLFHHYL